MQVHEYDDPVTMDERVPLVSVVAEAAMTVYQARDRTDRFDQRLDRAMAIIQGVAHGSPDMYPGMLEHFSDRSHWNVEVLERLGKTRPTVIMDCRINAARNLEIWFAPKGGWRAGSQPRQWTHFPSQHKEIAERPPCEVSWVRDVDHLTYPVTDLDEARNVHRNQATRAIGALWKAWKEAAERHVDVQVWNAVEMHDVQVSGGGRFDKVTVLAISTPQDRLERAERLKAKADVEAKERAEESLNTCRGDPGRIALRLEAGIASGWSRRVLVSEMRSFGVDTAKGGLDGLVGALDLARPGWRDGSLKKPDPVVVDRSEPATPEDAAEGSAVEHLGLVAPAPKAPSTHLPDRRPDPPRLQRSPSPAGASTMEAPAPPMPSRDGLYAALKRYQGPMPEMEALGHATLDDFVAAFNERLHAKGRRPMTQGDFPSNKAGYDKLVRHWSILDRDRDAGAVVRSEEDVSQPTDGMGR